MTKDDYLDKRIPEGSGEPDWHMADGSTITFIESEGKDVLKGNNEIDEWWVEQDKDEEWIKKTEKELF